MTEGKSYLRRYTDVLSLLDIIKNNRLTLLSPTTWFDQNDNYGLVEYGKRMGDGTAYALCMTEGEETGHHWQLFAGSSHGVCLVFDAVEFKAFCNGTRRQVFHGPMQYKSLSQVRGLGPIKTRDLPFLKRDTFKDEKEYRVIAWKKGKSIANTYTIPMPARLIRKVIFGPKMPDALSQTLKYIGKSHEGCSNIEWSYSRICYNKSWRDVIRSGLKSVDKK